MGPGAAAVYELLSARDPAQRAQGRALLPSLEWEEIGFYARLFLIADLLIRIGGPGLYAPDRPEDVRRVEAERLARVREASRRLPRLPAADLAELEALARGGRPSGRIRVFWLRRRGPKVHARAEVIVYETGELVSPDEPYGAALALRGAPGRPLAVSLDREGVLVIPF